MRALASPASPRQSAPADDLERRGTHRFHGKQRGDERGTGTDAVDVLVSAVSAPPYRSRFACNAWASCRRAIALAGSQALSKEPLRASRCERKPCLRDSRETLGLASSDRAASRKSTSPLRVAAEHLRCLITRFSVKRAGVGERCDPTSRLRAVAEQDVPRKTSWLREWPPSAALSAARCRSGSRLAQCVTAPIDTWCFTWHCLEPLIYWSDGPGRDAEAERGRRQRD